MNETQESARLLVVEDNVTTARTLRLFLEPQGYVVIWARDGAEALGLAASGAFDLVVLDLMLPDVDGLTVCRTLRRTSAVPIVMLTARTAEDDIVEGLDAGADDYVCKPFGSKVLLARIRRCLRRAGDVDPAATVIRVGGLALDMARRAVHLEGAPIRLTRTEFDILHQFMRRPGRVLTRAWIIEHAIGPAFDGFDRTVDTHIWSLRKKLGDRRDGQRLIVSEPGIGYRLVTPDGE